MSYWQLIKEHPIKFVLSSLVSLILVYFAFRDLEWLAFWEALKSIDYPILFAGAVVLVTSNIVRAARWKILLSPQKSIKRKHLFEATMIGYMGSNVLPFKLGEVLRALVVSKRHDVSVTGVGASIVVERSLDIVSFLIIAGIYGVLVPSFESARLLSGLGLLALVGMLAFSFWMNRNHDRVVGLMERWASGFRKEGHPKRAEHILSIFKGLETLWRMPKPGWVVLQTLTLWTMYLTVTFLAFRTFDFGLSIPASLNVAFVLMVFSTLSLSIPAAPGYVGTYHSAVLAALLVFGIEGDSARAFAIVLHLMNFLIYTPAGAWYLMKAGLTLDLATKADNNIRLP
jgi:uncharacterized protein (TIRG00374 family)